MHSMMCSSPFLLLNHYNVYLHLILVSFFIMPSSYLYVFTQQFSFLVPFCHKGSEIGEQGADEVHEERQYLLDVYATKCLILPITFHHKLIHTHGCYRGVKKYVRISSVRDKVRHGKTLDHTEM